MTSIAGDFHTAHEAVMPHRTAIEDETIRQYGWLALVAKGMCLLHEKYMEDHDAD